ncbi:MAG TPA: hypothetical protein VNO21_06785, partial [Polyangiaceae bacterium]|nr:hypothetical protein [Polyangiaceae bacterium]
MKNVSRFTDGPQPFTAHYPWLAVGVFILVGPYAGCAASTQRPVEQTARPSDDVLDANALRSMRATYQSTHRGDHPTWESTLRIALDRTTYAGRSVWRRSYSFESSSPATTTDMIIRGTMFADGATLAPLEMQDTFGEQQSRFVWQKDHVAGELKENEKEPSKAIHISLPARLSIDFGALDFLLPSLPL